MEQKRKQYGSKRKKRNRRPEEAGRGSAEKNKSKRAGKGPGEHVRDVNSHEIFRNEKLVCQFLKNYTDIPIFDGIRPEDIEDVTERYRAYLGVEFEADSIKRVKIRAGEEKREIFVVPLIEHKSRVDYDVQMQLLRYMSVIWYDYGKRQNKLAGRKVTKQKGFRYPLIIPIVYYEGGENWTADACLWKRVELGEEMRAYIPDFSYKVVRVHDYTNEEIRKHRDEMSLVMMLNRIQSPEDYTEFIRSSEAYMTEVVKDAPQELLEILQEVFWALLMKMNVPQEAAEELMENLGAKNMGYLFENAEKMDIQAERRNTLEAQKRAEEAEQAVQKAEESLSAIKSMLSSLIKFCRDQRHTKEETKAALRDVYQVRETDLEKYFEEAWNNNKES